MTQRSHNERLANEARDRWRRGEMTLNELNHARDLLRRLPPPLCEPRTLSERNLRARLREREQQRTGQPQRPRHLWNPDTDYESLRREAWSRWRRCLCTNLQEFYPELEQLDECLRRQAWHRWLRAELSFPELNAELERLTRLLPSTW